MMIEGENQRPLEINLSLCYLAHHKSYMDPGSEPGTLHIEAGDCPFELWNKWFNTHQMLSLVLCMVRRCSFQWIRMEDMCPHLHWPSPL